MAEQQHRPSRVHRALADSKRYLWLIGLVVPSLAFIGFGMWALTGWGVWFWIGPIVILVIVPAIDLVAGLDRSNPPDDVIEALEKDRYYRWITYLFLPIQYAGFVGAICLIAQPIGSTCRSSTRSASRSRSAASAASASTPRTSSATRRRPTSAGCPRSRWPRASTATSTSSTTAATTSGSPRRRTRRPRGSARASTQFWPRTVSARCGRPGASRSAGSPAASSTRSGSSNDVLNAWLMSAVLWGAWSRGSASEILPYLVIQAVVGFSLLEVVNYMEHYGMLRQKVGVGERQRYERVDPSHSWNSNNIATNVLLYHLQRHSDHHANPTRRYQSLRDFEESPVLPTGYAGMIVLAIVPAVWRRVMDPRVLAHFDGDLSQRQPEPAQARQVPREVRAPARVETRREVEDGRGSRQRCAPSSTADEVLAARCPGCGYTYDVEDRRRARGLRGRHGVGRHPRRLVLPRLRRARQGRLRPGRGIDAVTVRLERREHPRADRRGRGRADHRVRLVGDHHGQARRPGRRQPADRLQRDRLQAAAGRGDGAARAGRFPGRGRRAFDAHPDDLVDAIRAACRGVLELAQDNRLLKAVVSATHGADTELLPLLTTHAEPLLETAKAVVRDRVAAYDVRAAAPSASTPRST